MTATGLTTGPGGPQWSGAAAVQYPAAKSVSGTSVKASAADARAGRFGSGGSKPEQTQDGQRGRLSDSGAVTGH